jgi:hypothetical protein
MQINFNNFINKKTLLMGGGVLFCFFLLNFIEGNFQKFTAYANDSVTIEVPITISGDDEGVIESEDHKVEGYAWSENIGWISMRSEKNEHWELVNSLDEEKYVFTTSSSYQKDAYHLEDTNQTGSINSVNLYIKGQGCIAPYARINGNDGSSGSVSCNNGGGFITSTLNHPTGDDWSWEDINNLQTVIELKSFSGNQGQIKYAYVEVFYDSDSIRLAPNSAGDFTEIEGMVPAKYGVTLKSDGLLEGYAWSENIGWISFNLSDVQGCPVGVCQPKIDINTNKVSGWAKILNSGEWVSLSGNTGEGGEYGVELVGSEFQGWAWGGDVVGWISFNCQNQSSCIQSNYNVSIDLSAMSPEIIFEEINESSYCDEQEPPVWLNWSYISEDSDPDKFDLQITTKNEFEDDELCGDGCVLDLSEVNYIDGDFYAGSFLSFENEYFARIRVEDEYGTLSDWDTKSFKTEIRYPAVSFSWSPSEFYFNEGIQFKDETNYYQWENSSNRNGDINLTWEFPSSALKENISGLRSEVEEISNEFNSNGEFEITLEVETEIKNSENNFINQTCKTTKSIKTGRSLPYWQEVY